MQRLRLHRKGPLRFGLLLAGVWMVSGGLLAAQAPTAANDLAQWKEEAARVTIVRDDWGIAHVHGKSDADAVFGMIYAQCEDDFNRVETNYLTSLGRTAEAEGENALWQDLRQRLFIDPAELQRQYAASPEWLKRLMNAWADGINFYLATHPETKPKVLTRFEPWMALSFTEGSIGGDMERIRLKPLQAFYDVPAPGAASSGSVDRPLPEASSEAAWSEPEPTGSNGFAIAPANTADHHALLLINPHTSFFFRSELQMASDDGLDAYGAVTWGQFFIYQGFNDRAGWMHTSSNVDAVDEYLEKVVHKGDGLSYDYGGQTRPFTTRSITLRYRTPQGMALRTFTALYTVHGPVIRKEGDRFVTIQLMNTPIPALEQSYLRTKARNYAEYLKTMELRANSSNNTIFADADGDIAYWQGDFIPLRDTRFDYTKPVDGSDPSTNWQGLMTVNQVPHLLNPKSGYLFNVNDSPWNGAGASSLRKADYPAYVEQGIESARGLHAMRVLAPNGTPRRDFTLDRLMHEAHDSFLPWFARTVPKLLTAYDALPADSPLRARLANPVAVLRSWDDRWSADSVATSVAVYWGTELMKSVGRPAHEALVPSEEWVATRVPPDALLNALAASTEKLASDFGSWRTPWGKINRFQRINGDIVQPFNDSQPSIPVPFTSSLWGSLASFGARQYPGTKCWYGTSGNSFVAVVEFGDKVRARGVTAGGESGHPESKHFDDEAERYASGNLREIYFYPEQLRGHTERSYHPGG
ncbi:MAG TPA: penicillin acylase family protein [Acidobacteriaceae bacterium]|nr:penicillin acylase family protein [Acidobacteriaceae bacterium]